nr:conserved hypothetical protein [Hymenolepis microstoma]
MVDQALFPPHHHQLTSRPIHYLGKIGFSKPLNQSNFPEFKGEVYDRLTSMRCTLDNVYSFGKKVYKQAVVFKLQTTMTPLQRFRKYLQLALANADEQRKMPIMNGEEVATHSSLTLSHLAGIPIGVLRPLLRGLRGVGVRIGQKRLLLGSCWASGGLAVLLLFCAIAMDSWLFTVERELDPSNGTNLYTVHSGLWRYCKKCQFMKEVGKNTQWNMAWLVHDYHFVNCSYIPHFQQRNKESGELKPTESILYSMRPAAFFPLVGLVLLCLGGGCGLAACWGRRRARLLLFLSGGFCIISGILILIGIVLYVGSVSLAFDSISGPLRVEIRYYYSFGTAFRLCIGAFVLSEFSGVFVVHLLLAELRHLQNQHKSKSCYSAMNSVSIDILSSSRIPTATTSVAQISLTENCLDKPNKSGDNMSYLTLNRRPQPTKTNHVPVANHANNALRVKVIPYHRSPVSGAKIPVPKINTHSMESLDQDLNNTDVEEPIRWAPVKQRRIVGQMNGSLNSVRNAGIGHLRRGNARSAVNIRTEEEIPDLMPCHKSARGSKQLLYYSCRECEEMAKMRQQHQRNNSNLMSGRSSSLLHQMPISDSSSTTNSDSMTPSISVTCSSYSGSDEKLSDKLYYDQSPRRSTSRSHCMRSRVNLISSASTSQRKISRSTFSESNKTLQSINPPLRGEETNTTSESERRDTEVSASSGVVCRCPENYSGGGDPMVKPNAENQPLSSRNTSVQRTKKPTKPYQQVTSI